MRKSIVSCFLLVASFVHAQVNSVKHIVSKGETLTQIARQYNVSVQSIMVINPSASEGIREHQVLLVPTSSRIEHQVQTKETLYGISKQYNIAIEKLYELNPGLKDNGLKDGQTLIISAGSSQSNTSIAVVTESKKTTTYEVKPGDTIYSIAIRNNVTVSELYESNPGLEQSMLQSGQLLVLPQKDIYANERNHVSKAILSSPTQKFTELKVAPKQTLYNIQRTYGVTEQQLKEWNPQLNDGLKEGMILQIVPNSVNSTKTSSSNTTESTTNKPKFEGFSSEGAKELVLLLPFDLDTNNPKNSTIHQNLTNNVFLNMAIDFYAGASLAIEELSKKDLPLTVRVIDSKESNRSMDVNALKSKFDFSKTDVIIGPFYQKNVDALSKAFQNTNTLIVSPLSTDKGQPFPNQVHTMPNEDLLKSEMIDYLQSKNANTIAVINPSDKNINSKYYQGKGFISKIETNAKGNVTKAMVEPKLKSSGNNLVILDTANLTTTIELINVLRGLQKQYSIQLVVLDRGQNLDSTDVSIEDLAQLNLLFPSVTNESKSNKRERFADEFRKKHGSNPSKFAVRGYDVVLDMVNRMFSGADGNIFEYGSQQVENKFTYIDNEGGIYNNGVFILEYDKNLTIKEAK